MQLIEKGRLLRFNLLIILSVSLLVVSLSGCGYRLAGRGALPGGIQTLSVQILENRSSQTGAEVLITNALISELSRRRQGSIVDAQDADANLSGVIDSLTWDTVTHKGLNIAAERRVYATVSLSLVDAKGDILWKRFGLKAEQAYAVVEGNKPATEVNRRNAIRELSSRLAETVYRRLTDQF